MKLISQLLAFSSTPDVIADNFVVPILTETIDKLMARAIELGFDGLEFLPNPNDIPDPGKLLSISEAAGAKIGVINSGRLQPNGYAILHKDENQRRKSIEVYKRLIDLAGAVGARVGLGMARGVDTMTAKQPELASIMQDVFGEIAEHAVQAGTVVMLEPADPGYAAAILTISEAVEQAELIKSPGFSIMIDTAQLDQIEDSVDLGFSHAKGLADHIHLYDLNHWPPGVRDGKYRLDWDEVKASMVRHKFQGSGSMVLVPEGDVDEQMKKATSFIRKTLMDDGS